MKTRWLGLWAASLLLAGNAAAQSKGRVVEDIVARVNNEIITRSDVDHADATLRDEVKQDCATCSPEQLEANYQQRKKDVLRDLIDQSLLVQRAKDEGLTVETEVVKRLDEIRQENKLASMEELQKAVEGQGLNFEDYRANIRNGILTQELIRRQVGGHIIIDKTEVRKYYDEHKSNYVRPEQVYLREIFVSTDGKKPEEIPALEKKTNDLLQRVKKGDDFGQMAQHFSEGTTAKRGGELGAFERGQLAKEIEDVVFKLKRNEVSPVIRTKQGFEILQVGEHYEAGQQPLEKVEDEITNRLYMEKMQPALREYLKTLREESFVVVKAGFVDTAGVASAPIQEVPASADAGVDKKEKHKRKKRAAA